MRRSLSAEKIILAALVILYSLMIAKEFLWLSADEPYYLDALLRSLAAHRPLRAPDLAPSNLTFTALSLAIFWLSGNFYLATFGLVAVSTVGIFALLFFLFRGTKHPAALPALLLLILGGHPCLWARASDFTGIPTYLCFFLLAILAEQRRWPRWSFYGLVILTFHIRQSGLVLLALPAWDLLTSQRRKELLWPALVAGFCLLSLRWGAPSSSLSRLGSWDVLSNVDGGRWLRHLVQSLVFLLPFFLSFSFLYRGDDRKRWKQDAVLNLSCGLLLAGLFYVLFNFSLADLTPRSLEPLLTTPWKKAYAVLALLCLPALNYRRFFINRYLCAASLSVFLLSLQPHLWDRYLLDALILLGLAFQSHSAEDIERSPAWHRATRAALLVGFILLAGYAYAQRIYIDKALLSARTYEHLLRQRRVEIHDLTDQPQAISNWKVLGLTEFSATRWPRPDESVVTMQTHLPWRSAYPREFAPMKVIEEGRASIGFFELPYRVVSHLAADEPRGTLPPIPFERLPCAPLDNAEWRTFMRSRGATCTPDSPSIK